MSLDHMLADVPVFELQDLFERSRLKLEVAASGLIRMDSLSGFKLS